MSDLLNAAFGMPGNAPAQALPQVKKPKKEKPRLDVFTAAKAQSIYSNPMPAGGQAPKPGGGMVDAMGTGAAWGAPK